MHAYLMIAILRRPGRAFIMYLLVFLRVFGGLFQRTSRADTVNVIYSPIMSFGLAWWIVSNTGGVTG